MKKTNLSKRVLICLFIAAIPLAQGCSTLRKPDFNYDPNQVSKILEAPAEPPPKWFQRTTDFGHHVGRATLISALVVAYAIVYWTDLLDDDDDGEFGFEP